MTERTFRSNTSSISVVRYLQEGRAPHQRAGIVDEDVEAAERGCRLLDHAARLAPLRQVAGDEVRGAAFGADFRGHGFRRLPARIVVHGDRRPVLRKGLGDRRADAGAGAGDEGEFSGEILQHQRAGQMQVPKTICASTV